jgi:hypothetical protein
MILFSDLDQDRALLGRSDDFTSRLGSFERQARMKSAHPVSENEFLAFAAACALPWEKQEQDHLKTVIRNIELRLQKYQSLFPAEMLLLKTNGWEEAGYAYTRQNAIILPPAKLAYPAELLERFLVHELFHILSRHQPGLRSELYGLLGFQPCDEIDWPSELRERRITNPDALNNDHYIRVQWQGTEHAVVPVLFSHTEHYDPVQGTRHLDYLVSRFMVIHQQNGLWQAKLLEGRPLLAEFNQVQGFCEQVGREVTQIEQPEELLAEDFVSFLFDDQNVPAPKILEGMRRIFACLP